MSATRDSTLADVRRSNVNLQRELDELRQRLDDRTHERDEALQRETATAEVLQVINSSPGDLTPVFHSIVEKAHALCGAAYGSLQLWDGEKFPFQGSADTHAPSAFQKRTSRPHFRLSPYRLR